MASMIAINVWLKQFRIECQKHVSGRGENRSQLEGISKFVLRKGCIVMITYELETHLVEDVIVLSSILHVVWKSLESRK